MLLMKSKDPKTSVICLYNLSFDENQTQICHNIYNTTTMFDLILFLKNRFGQNNKINLYTNRINLFKGNQNTYVCNILKKESTKTIYFQIEDNDKVISSKLNQQSFQSCVFQENDSVQQASQYDQQELNTNQIIQQSSANTYLVLESTNNTGQIGQLNSQTISKLNTQSITSNQSNHSFNEFNQYYTDSQICQLQDGAMNGNQKESDIENAFILLQKKYVSLQQKFKTLENDNQRLKSQNEDLQKACEEQKNEILNLRKRVDIKLKKEDQNIQNTQLQASIENLRNENFELKTKIQKNEKIYFDQKSNQDKEILDLNKIINDKDNELNKLKEQLKGLLNRIEIEQPKIEKQIREQKVEYQSNLNSTQLNQNDIELNKEQDQYSCNKSLREPQIKRQQQQQQQQLQQFQDIQQKEQTVQQQKQKLIIQEIEQKDEYLTQCGHKIQWRKLQAEIRSTSNLGKPLKCPQCLKIIDLEYLYNNKTNVQLETTTQKSEDQKKMQIA